MNAKLNERSGGKCELCGSAADIATYHVLPDRYSDNEVAICQSCRMQIDNNTPMVDHYWHFLSETMWSEVPAIQVLAWRMLNRLRNESWAADNLDMLYLDDETLAWAKAGGDPDEQPGAVVHKDSHGNVLQNGDSVVITKTLDVKGSSINAKLGTVVKNIRLVEDNPEQVEGRVEGQLIVILTKYLKRQN
ncbi:PhnA domain-containing protein [Parapedobacter lycopersici]|uniref:PhnA domain-containing protein n=1 Tax=Parapedobacter lycopersici TaxID=1864939 RepID=UPI00214D6722|nr:alkylphosphonate utilization protein [Parapedobacter lycopersici]